jgi:CRP-like cAMP-binding protein
MFASKQLIDPLSPLARDAFASADSLVPLKSLRPSFREDLFLHVVVQTLAEGEIIFEQGVIDNQYIYLHSGSIELEFASGHKETLKARSHFLPLAHSQPRTCKAIALSDCTLIRVDEDRLDRTLSWSQMTDFLLSELAMHRDYDKDFDWMQTILNSNLFFKVPSVNADQIFSRLTEIKVDEGDEIIRQGDSGSCCYFLKNGSADIKKDNRKVAEISAGRCFGEDALVNDQRRNATVVMTSEGALMRLEKEDFKVLLKEPEVDEIEEGDLSSQFDTPILIDVRTEEEYRLGHIAFSANMPLSLMAMKKRLLSEEKLYVLYCDSGRRSRAAAYFLGKEGYNVVALRGGIRGQGLTDRLVSEEGYMLRNGELVESES